MYQILIDGNILHDVRLDTVVLNPKLTLEVNKTGSLEFTIDPTHSLYSYIKKLTSKVEVYDDGELIFKGRPINDTTNFNKLTTIYCEGDLSFFNDTTMTPYEFSGTIRDYLELLIGNHNNQVDSSKQFLLGDVTVTDPNEFIVRSNIEYVKTWEELKNKTFSSSLGGYLIIRYVDDINYIDYLQDSTYISSQKIELTENMLDYNRTIKASEIATVLIPLGAKLKDDEGNDTDERLTIKSVNDGKDYVNHDIGISKYGRIVDYKIYDDVTIPSNLVSRANQELNFRVNLGISMKIKAIDLSMVKEPELWGRNLLLLSDTPTTLIGIKWTDYTGKKWSEI